MPAASNAHTQDLCAREQVLRWTRFHHAQTSGDAKKKEFLDNLPSSMQRELITAIFGDVLLKVPLFDYLQVNL
jgi:hypothetical protein